MTSSPSSTTGPDALLDMVQRWVCTESPSHDVQALRAMADVIVKDAETLGLDTRVVALGEASAPVVIVHNRAAGDVRPGILVIGHYDTVHPIGVLQKNSWRIEGDRIYGPGIYDMKAGVCLALHGLAAAQAAGGTRLPVDVIIVPDEEIGTAGSRAVLLDMARGARFALACEPARAEGGRCVTARKGTGHITVRAFGRPSHAGMKHELGRNAIEEMAHQVLALQAMTDYARGVTVSVGTIKGGTTTNVVPDYCEIVADFRMPDPEAVEELRRKVSGLHAQVPDVRLEVVFSVNRPPMPRTEAVGELLARCQGFAQRAGFDLQEAPMTGGAGDVNFTAEFGLPSLDGLGADGDGAHTLGEHILASTLPRRQMFWKIALQELA